MTYEPKKSDLAKVAMKPTNKAGLKTAAELVEQMNNLNFSSREAQVGGNGKPVNF